jgi:hypothetical protein
MTAMVDFEKAGNKMKRVGFIHEKKKISVHIHHRSVGKIFLVREASIDSKGKKKFFRSCVLR